MLDKDVLGDRQPDLSTTLHSFRHVGHVDEGLHVEALLDQFDSLAREVRHHLVSLLGAPEDLLHIGLCKLQEGSHRGRDGRRLGVGHRTTGGSVPVGVSDRVDQQVRVVFEVILCPHQLMPGDLFRQQDRLFHGA